MRTVLQIAGLAAIGLAVLVALTGRDPFYHEAVSGAERQRAMLLWGLGGVALILASTLV